VGFAFDHTHRCSQMETRGSGLEGLAPPLCGQLTRCFSAAAELLVHIVFICTVTYELINDDDDDDKIIMH